MLANLNILMFLRKVSKSNDQIKRTNNCLQVKHPFLATMILQKHALNISTL